MSRSYRLAATGALALSLVATSRAACGDTEQDRLVWARERMHPNAAAAQLALVYRWLVNGTRSCPASGDLWYYRGLVAKKINDSADSEYAFRKADEYSSKAKAQRFDPFAPVTHEVAPNPNAIRNKWALIIGVGEFKNTDDYLEYSVTDANELGGVLVESAHFPKENVKVLVDEKATTSNIREAFGEIRTRAKPEDLILIYISSHGHPRDLDPTGLSYVLTYDTNTATSAKLFASALQMVELAELGRWALARDFVLLLDTCYSGAARPGVSQEIVPQGSDGLDPLQGLAGSGNRVVISASRADERSYEDPQNKHGFFTRFLLDALRKDARNQPLSDLFNYVGSGVSAAVGQQQGRQQHPVMQNYGNGKDIVLDAPLLTASATRGAVHRTD